MLQPQVPGPGQPLHPCRPTWQFDLQPDSRLASISLGICQAGLAWSIPSKFIDPGLWAVYGVLHTTDDVAGESRLPCFVRRASLSKRITQASKELLQKLISSVIIDGSLTVPDRVLILRMEAENSEAGPQVLYKPKLQGEQYHLTDSMARCDET